jgi:broad specificity phosphatase PhoE
VTERLRAGAVAAVYSSDLGRALETATEIAAPHDLSVVSLLDLREINFGRWEGLTFEEIASQDEQLAAAWVADPARIAPPDGETLLQVIERMNRAVSEIEARVGNGTAVAVTHGGPIRGLLCDRLGVPPEHHWQFQIDAGSITVVEFHPAGAILSRLNDASHLVVSKAEGP